MDGCGSQLLQADQGRQSGLKRLPSSTKPCAATGCEGAAALRPSSAGSAHLRLTRCLRSKVMDSRLPCRTRLVASRLSLWRI